MGYSKGQAIAIGVLFGLLPVPFVGLRIKARRMTRAKLGIDDWLTVPAMILCIAMGFCIILDACIGGLGQHNPLQYGRHGQPIMPDVLITFTKIRFAMTVMSPFLLVCSKLSVLFFYRRIFSTPGFRKINDIFIVIVIGWCLSLVFPYVFACNPVSAQWDLFMWELPSKCLEMTSLYNYMSVSDTITDLVILALPIPMVIKLQLPLREKLALAGVFLMGTFVMFASIARVIVYALCSINEVVQDTTYYQSAVVYWSLIENSVAVVSTTLPALRPVIWAAASEIRSRSTSLGLSLRSTTSGSGSGSGSPTSPSAGGWSAKGASWRASRLTDEDAGAWAATPSAEKPGARHGAVAEIPLHDFGGSHGEKEASVADMV